ncbi:MAG: HPP family protein [Conexivisphaera sp.]
MDRARLRHFTMYLAVLTAILWMSSISRQFVLAPPYAVSAYLLTFERDTKFSRRSGFVASYLFAVASSEALHAIVGSSELAMSANIVLVSMFVAMTRYCHPPAIALTIFSYLVYRDLPFVVTSLAVIALVLAASFAEDLLMHSSGSGHVAPEVDGRREVQA